MIAKAPMMAPVKPSAADIDMLNACTRKSRPDSNPVSTLFAVQ